MVDCTLRSRFRGTGRISPITAKRSFAASQSFSLDDCAAVKKSKRPPITTSRPLNIGSKDRLLTTKSSKTPLNSCTSPARVKTQQHEPCSDADERPRGSGASLKRFRGIIANYAHQWAEIPMLSRTHGQTASPTTVGKEFANVAVRLARVIEAIKSVKILAKMNGSRRQLQRTPDRLSGLRLGGLLEKGC